MYLTRKQKEAVGVGIALAVLIPAVAVGLVIAGRNREPASPAAQEPVPAQQQLPAQPLVTYADGLVEGSNEGADLWGALAAGARLESASRVRTGPGSAADIRLQQGSVVRVMEETLFSLADLGMERIEMDLVEGEVVSRLERISGNQEFTIRSTAVTAGVRGTELVVTTTGDGATVYGVSGSVEVFNPEFPEEVILLARHQKSQITPDEPAGAAVPMSEAEIRRYRRVLDSLREEQVLLVTETLTFEPNSADLTPQAEAELQRIYEELREVEQPIRIIGHSADIGSVASQFRVSTERAQAVRAYLVSLGMSADELTALGVGSSQPATEGTSQEELARNRRVEFLLED